MGKHDKHIEASSEEFLKNRINDLEKRLEFANDTIKKLQEQCGRMSKWASEIEANASETITALEEEVAVRDAKIAKLVRLYV